MAWIDTRVKVTPNQSQKSPAHSRVPPSAVVENQLPHRYHAVIKSDLELITRELESGSVVIAYQHLEIVSGGFSGDSNNNSHTRRMVVMTTLLAEDPDLFIRALHRVKTVYCSDDNCRIVCVHQALARIFQMALSDCNHGHKLSYPRGEHPIRLVSLWLKILNSLSHVSLHGTPIGQSLSGDAIWTASVRLQSREGRYFGNVARSRHLLVPASKNVLRRRLRIHCSGEADGRGGVRADSGLLVGKPRNARSALRLLAISSSDRPITAIIVHKRRQPSIFPALHTTSDS